MSIVIGASEVEYSERINVALHYCLCDTKVHRESVFVDRDIESTKNETNIPDNIPLSVIDSVQRWSVGRSAKCDIAVVGSKSNSRQRTFSIALLPKFLQIFQRQIEFTVAVLASVSGIIEQGFYWIGVVFSFPFFADFLTYRQTIFAQTHIKAFSACEFFGAKMVQSFYLMTCLTFLHSAICKFLEPLIFFYLFGSATTCYFCCIDRMRAITAARISPIFIGSVKCEMFKIEFLTAKIANLFTLLHQKFCAFPSSTKIIPCFSAVSTYVHAFAFAFSTRGAASVSSRCNWKSIKRQLLITLGTNFGARMFLRLFRRMFAHTLSPSLPAKETVQRMAALNSFHYSTVEAL